MLSLFFSSHRRVYCCSGALPLLASVWKAWYNPSNKQRLSTGEQLENNSAPNTEAENIMLKVKQIAKKRLIVEEIFRDCFDSLAAAHALQASHRKQFINHNELAGKFKSVQEYIKKYCIVKEDIKKLIG